MFRRTLPLLLVLAPLVARAQTPAPILIQSGTQIGVPVPPTNDRVRLQLLLAGSNQVLDDERAKVQNGTATARLEADPGQYDVRVVSNTRERTPLGSSRRFLIPGLKREAGRWLFNGSPVAYVGMNSYPTISFIPNLKRTDKTKLPFVFPTDELLKWDVVGMYSVEQGFPGLRVGQQAITTTSLPSAVGEKVTPHLLGSTGSHVAANVLGMVDEGIDQGAPQADAIVIKGNDQSSIKVARRNVEEAPNFDLPVFAQFQTPPTSTDLLQAFQSGASGLIVPEGTTNPIIDILNRNSARLSGSVTLEDVGLRAKDFNRFAPVLRQAGRIPLLARLPGEGNDPKKRDNDKNAESLFVGFDSTTDAATLDKIERAAKVGSTIYCEGALPSALWPRWSDISKLQLTQQKLRTQSVTLDDPWIWGTLNGQGFDVEQKMGVAVRTNLPPQIKEQKGEARETVARPLAKFEDGSNAIVLCPVGKGRIIWAPFDVARLHVSEDGTTGQAQKIAYYAAVSGVMQAALVQLTATRGDASAVSVALRGTLATPGDEKSLNGTLVAFFNSSKEPVDLEANVRGDGAYVLDLDTDTTIPAKVRDYGTRFSLSVPANGYRFVAIAKDAQTWNDTGKNSVRARLR